MHPIWRLKIIYCFVYAVYGVVLPFLPVILQEKNLDVSAMSIVLIGFGLAAFLPPLIVAHFADRKLPWSILMALLLFSTAGCAQSWHYISSTYAFFAATFIFFSFFLPAAALIDTFTIRLLQRDYDPGLFPRIRLYGSIGFMLPSVYLWAASYSQNIDATALINLTSIIAVIAAFFTFLLPIVIPAKSTLRLPIVQAFKLLIGNELRPTYLAALFAATGLTFFYILSPKYLSELGFDTVVIGLIINFAVLAETLCMTQTKYFVTRFGMHFVVLIGVAAVALRLFSLVIWPTFSVVMLTQLLHAPIVIGLFVVAPMLIVTKAGSTFQFSTQAIYTATTLGFARIVAAALSAIVFAVSSNSVSTNLSICFLLGTVLATIGVFLSLSRKEQV